MFKQIVSFLAEKYPTQSEREALVIRAFYDYPTIKSKLNLVGTPISVATHLVSTLQQEDEIAPGLQALWQLLLTAREDFGFSVQAQIDRFKPYANKEGGSPPHGNSSPPSSPSSSNTPSSSSGPLPSTGGGPTLSNSSAGTTGVGSTTGSKKNEWTAMQIAVVGAVIAGIFAIIAALITILPPLVERNEKLATQSALELQVAQTPVDQVLGIPSVTPAPSSETLSLPATTSTSSPTPTITSTPQNGLLAFNVRGDVYIMNTDGSGLKSLITSESNYYNSNVAWAPDGQHVAFQSDKDGTAQIYVMGYGRMVDPRVKKITNEGENTFPSWSVDGKQIIFSRDNDIYVMDADGSNVKYIARGNRPSWSIDGKQIIFSRDNDIYVMDANGNNVTHLTDGIGYATWSPDSKKILFSRFNGIYIMDADGSNVKYIVDGSEAVWSPDGLQIAFTLLGDIYIADARENSAPQLLYSSNIIEFALAWQPIPWYITLTPNP